MAASSGFSASPIWGKFQVSLGKPLVQRCQELEHLLVNTSNKDLSAILPGLLEHIFGFGMEPGWGLDQISKAKNMYEFDAVCRLLKPDGTLMNLVYNLQTDVYLTFEFPFSFLPGPTRHMIEEGSLPIFYVNKLQYQGYSKPTITLGAFELYMYYFCYTLVHSNWQLKSLNWNNMSEVVYPFLVDEYFKYFLPLNKKSLPKFPQSSASAIRSPMMQQATPTSSRHSPNTGTHTRSRSRLGLLRASVLSPQKQHSQSSPSTEKAEGEIWWSETFIQIVAEFWLNQNALDTERGISPQNLESFMPSNNHVRLVRLLFKHLHYFVNSVEPETIASPYNTVESSPLDEFKRSLLPSLLQKKIYSFLRHGFDRWPLDSSFRLILETWLTYIQPWRYKDTASSKTPAKDSDRVTDEWFPFIRDNFLFYSAIFQEFLQRTRRMHMTSIHNAYIVFRVSKVFSLTNFPQLLREVEKMMFFSGYKQMQDLGGSYIAPEISTMLRIQMSELERPDFQYVNLFGHEMNTEIHHLLQQINAAREVLNVQQPEKKTEKSGFAAFFDMSSLFEDNTKAYGDMSFSEVKKLMAHLEQAAANYCIMFGIKASDQSMYAAHHPLHTSYHSADQSSMLNISMSTSIPGTPDCCYTQHGPQLTPAGRYQLMNGLKKFDVGYQGDPDLQPIRSYENTTLVRVLYRVSTFLNKLFEDRIQRLYTRTDILGKMSQVYFAAPLSPSKIPSSPMREEMIETLKTPRLSLRFLASYQTLLYLGIMYVFLRLSFGFGPIGYFLMLALFVFVYGLFRALTLKEDMKVN